MLIIVRCTNPFFSPKIPNQPWFSTRLLLVRYLRLLPLFQNGRSVKLTKQFDLVQSSRVSGNTGCTQRNGAFSKVNKKFISNLTRAQRTPSAAATVQVSHALPAVRFSCLLRGRGASFQDGVSARKGFLCAPF